MKNNFDKFIELHKGPEPLLVGNVWNVQSARVYEQKGFKAVATSSAAVAETLGYADGEEMSFEEYFMIIRRIASGVSIPFSVDLESGYGHSAEEIASNIRKLANVGVSGINIEDSYVEKGKRGIVDAQDFTGKLKRIVTLLNESGVPVFINVRCDSFLLGLPNALEDALARMALYQQTGVHGLFFPCISKISDITAATGACKLPVNVMCIPGLPDFQQLKAAGVKRISMGNFLNKKTYDGLGVWIAQIVGDGNFNNLFATNITRA
ncbi:MAG TPA: isocitrate lyase/phosphoenolpyruvate mutase family protein [Chryseosolibacter sp.]|nr:isocitrate lyase/phosphoenolpyruvate mutase family protein [Chryseosolibacter sp.]